MATCKDCLHWDICKEHDRLMLTVNTFFELKYQNAVEQFCKHFKSTADVAEVKHGEWVYDYTSECIPGTDATLDYKCSECGDRSAEEYKYCPNCGAKMDGGKK